MNDRFIRLSISLARLQKVIQRIKASGMSRIELKAGHTLVLCRLAAAVSELFGENSVTEFLEAVAAVWSMLAALTICQGVYFIAATALMAT